ncbi:flagellar biosynthetic protein FliO [Caldanaerobacter sp.]|uniref:flagellar biosynthetic protein FliO n=1 Tax=Caldanaerobacter sp. TaxID=2930036 RepID=UPI003C7797DA
MSYWIQLIWYLVAFFLVIGAAFYITRFIGQASVKFSQSHNIELLDFASLGRDKGLFIVRVGGRVILIGVTNNSITYLLDLEEQKLNFEKSKSFASDFNVSLEKFRKFLKKDGDK